jgi:hypothetical protein
MLSKKLPFDASLTVTFRKRLNATVIDEINERICVKAVKKLKTDKTATTKENRGALLSDAAGAT